MRKPVTISAIPVHKRQSIELARQKRLETRARLKAKKVAQRLKNTVEPAAAYREVDPIEFARAFRPFVDDIELLDPDDQEQFKSLLMGYLAGSIDHEVWRRSLGILSALKRACAPPLPRNYWKRDDC
jgi:hypothetical protein